MRQTRSIAGLCFLGLLAAMLAPAGCGPDVVRTGRGGGDGGQDQGEHVKVAFITNSEDPFWDLAEQGCKLAEKDFNCECQFLAPPNGTVAEQQQYIEDMITVGCRGLAISPIDPVNQSGMINQACEEMPVICQDSDAPNTERKFYLGTSNYMAGRSAGELVKQACPEGGQVMIFVGKLEVLNAQQRSRGLIDELAGKPAPENIDLPGVGYDQWPVQAGKFEILGIQTDNKDEQAARAKAEDTITKYRDIKCMVGLWAYNPPQILGALESAGKVGEVQIVGFDEHETTLQAIAEGKIYGTVVQQPFVFGYTSVEYLTAMARDKNVPMPEGGKLYIEHKMLTKENVDAWKVKVAAMREGRGTAPAKRLK